MGEAEDARVSRCEGLGTARREKRWRGLGVSLGKCPSPADYEQAAVFLASDDTAMIKGTDLRVDAGALARYWLWGPSVPPA
jgi:hypothetical protein